MKSDPWVTTAFSMLTCICISEQVLCQQLRTWELFLLQWSLQSNLLELYFRRLERAAESAREPFSSSFPTLNLHLTLQPVLPKCFFWRPLWDLPFELQYTWSSSSTLSILFFPEYQVLWTHELLTHIYWRLKKKKTTRKKTTKPIPKACWRAASWTKHTDFSKPRQRGQGWASDTLCAYACQESKLRQPCYQSYRPPRPLFHSRGRLVVSPYCTCCYFLQN